PGAPLPRDRPLTRSADTSSCGPRVRRRRHRGKRVHVSVAAVEQYGPSELPAHWPDALHPDVLETVEEATPFLVCDLATVRDRYRRLVACLPGVDCYYALKCNSELAVLEELRGLGSRFEIASAGELALLAPLGVDAADVVYSNPVK